MKSAGRILTVVGLASAGTVVGLMRLWQLDGDGIDEFEQADDDW